MGFFGVNSSKIPVVSYASTFASGILAMSVSPDTVPILMAAFGFGVTAAWSWISGNRDRANQSLVKQIEFLQSQLEAKDKALRDAVQFSDEERAKIIAAKLKLEQDHERLVVRFSGLEERLNLLTIKPKEPA